MPTKTFTAAATFTSTAGQLVQSALSLTATRTQTFNKDSRQASYIITANNGEEIIYSTSEATTPLVYIFVQADTSNATGSANDLSLVYSGSAATTTIAKLKAGDWAYFPYSGSNATALKVVNPAATTASINVIVAESGSL